MVEQNAVTGIHAVGFTVVHGDPVRVQFRHRVRRTWVERGSLFLRNFLHQTVQLRGGCLVETGFLLKAEEANRFQQTQRTHCVNVSGVFRRFEGDRNVAHRAQVVHFIRLHFLQNTGQVGSIGQVAVVQMEFRVRRMRILINVIHTFGVE